MDADRFKEVNALFDRLITFRLKSLNKTWALLQQAETAAVQSSDPAPKEMIIKARRFRSQDKNRKDAIDRLVELIRKAAVKPKPRRKTRPSPAASERRLSAKKKRGEIKHHRRGVKLSEDH